MDYNIGMSNREFDKTPFSQQNSQCMPQLKMTGGRRNAEQSEFLVSKKPPIIEMKGANIKPRERPVKKK